jgi:hypothetical protein
MQKHHANLSSYQFKRAKTRGLIEVLNEGSYVMAQYSERTGTVKWQRVVLASQRELIEKWLGEHYPVQAATQPESRAQVSAQSAPASVRKPSGKKLAKRTAA